MTHVKLLFLTLLSTNLFVSGSACPELDQQCRERSQENIEWMASEISWRNSLAEWKRLVEDECESVVGENWHMLFKCPDFSGIRCVYESARRNETDLLNCTLIFCEDGRYYDQKLLRAIWKKMFKAYKDILEVYKDKLRHCPRRDCNDFATATEEPSTSTDQGLSTTERSSSSSRTPSQESPTTAMPHSRNATEPRTTTDQGPSTTDDNKLASSTTPSQESSTTSTPLFGNTTGCTSSVFEFPEKGSFDYVQYKGTLPAMTSFTTCAWVSPHTSETLTGTLMSYCSTGAADCNTIYVYFYPNEVEVSLNENRIKFASGIPITDRSLVCVMMSPKTGKVHYYVNATEAAPGIALSVVVPQGGVLILGQDQDGAINGATAGPPNQSEDAFLGRVDGFTLWNRILTEAEMTDMYQSGCNCAKDAIVVFNSTNSIVKSAVTASWDRACADIGS